jgi:transposase
VANPRESSNSAEDFLEVIQQFIQCGALVAGDVLVCDNATVHTADAIFLALITLLNNHDINLIFLPKYSPELNPCELVFGGMKNHIYYYRTREQLWLEVAKGLTKVTREHVISFYSHCTLSWST